MEKSHVNRLRRKFPESSDKQAHRDLAHPRRL
jgi:hypothetical protein